MNKKSTKKQKKHYSTSTKNIVFEAVSLSKKVRTENQIVEVLKDLNLIIREGDFLAILGPNSLGKGLLIDSFVGMEEIDKGELYLNGERFDNASELARRNLRGENMGFLFRNVNLIPTLNVRDNIELNYNKKSGSKNFDLKLNSLLEEFELKEKQDKLPSELTFFDSQKVSLIRALINDPKIIWAEEPTETFDSKEMEEFVNILSRVNREKNVAVVVITDNINLGARAGKLLRLENGKFN